MSAFLLGLDVGGTKIAAGLLSWPEGTVVERRVIQTNAVRGGRAVLDDALGLARNLAARRPSAIGIGLCELVDREGRIASANCVDWRTEPVREEFSSIAPIIIEADVRAAALAEFLFGAGKSFRNFLYVTIGTGISCCLMLDGKPYLGARGATGTMASSPIAVRCEQCGNMSRRSLEEIAAGPSLVARYNATGGHATSGRDVIAATAAGEAAARRVVESAAETLGSQLGILISTLDPETVIIGGGLGLSDGPYWEHLLNTTRQAIWADAQRDLPIVRAATGEDAGWIGAAAKAGQHFHKQLNLEP